jgi:hypothetical protein
MTGRGLPRPNRESAHHRQDQHDGLTHFGTPDVNVDQNSCARRSNDTTRAGRLSDTSVDHPDALSPAEDFVVS